MTKRFPTKTTPFVWKKFCANFVNKLSLLSPFVCTKVFPKLLMSQYKKHIWAFMILNHFKLILSFFMDGTLLLLLIPFSSSQAITSAGFHIAQVIQLFSSWRSRRILPTNSYSCLSLLLVSHQKCRMNLIGPWHLGAFLRDQSDSSYVSYVRQVARTNKNIEFVGWILVDLEDENSWNTGAVRNPALVMT